MNKICYEDFCPKLLKNRISVPAIRHNESKRSGVG